jgi:hypothetical protein
MAPIFDRLRNPALEKIRIQILPVPREPAGNNLRTGIENAHAEELVAPVLDRNDISIRRRAEGF